jgi:hypothetical protein
MSATEAGMDGFVIFGALCGIAALVFVIAAGLLILAGSDDAGRRY